MGKRDDYRREVAGLLEGFAATGEAGPLESYLLAHSNLPGPRGNLELAWAFGDAVEALAPREADRLAGLCLDLTRVSPEEAPVNTPEEFLPFCGAVGLGALGAVSPGLTGQALAVLRSLARDPRWRMREGVAFALQLLLVGRRPETMAALEGWVSGGDPLEMRAAAAAVAEPALLHDGQTALAALALHQRIFDQVLLFGERRSDAFRTLRKGLGYTLSVVVQARPTEGFALMARLAGTGDPDLRWILKENLKKNRLVKNYPAQVASLQDLL